MTFLGNQQTRLFAISDEKPKKQMLDAYPPTSDLIFLTSYPAGTMY
jgi:hypothetical protein